MLTEFTVDFNLGLAAFLAGLFSFLAPCVLPLVPAYLGYLSGYAVVKPQGEERTWHERFFVALHAASFVVGFSIVFVLMGIAAGTLGQLLRGAWLRYAGGIIIIFFGLALMNLLNLPFLYREAKLEWRGNRKWGFLSSALIGVVFAAGWTPCVGPALTAILLLSAKSETVVQGAFLLAVYAAGMGLPFILAGVFIDQLSAVLNRVGRYLPLIQKLSGALLVLIGVLLITDGLDTFGIWLEKRGIGWDLGI